MTVTLNAKTEKTLSKLVESEGIAPEVLLDRAVEQYRRSDFIRRANESVAMLRADPDAWAEELSERKEWDSALMDGLEKDEWVEPAGK
jgi:hypothetical protein